VLNPECTQPGRESSKRRLNAGVILIGGNYLHDATRQLVLRHLVEGVVDEWTSVRQSTEMVEAKCPRCQQVISFDATVQIRRGVMSHADCRRPHDLSPEERAILFRFCWNHAVAKCVACTGIFRQDELGGDLLSHRIHLCPRCRADLTESVRGHLYSCAILPTEVRLKAGEMRDAARKLVTQRHHLSDRADDLIREAEAAASALRETMTQTAWHD